jgi:hypothetical protein
MSFDIGRLRVIETSRGVWCWLCMKRSTAITLFVFSLVILTMVGILSHGDHRTDRNVPGSTTGAGRASIADPGATFQERGIQPPPR